MRVVLLGTAAGGGVPQWNCACGPCAAVRAGTLPARGQDCVAVSGNDRDWWLLNASPDIRTQLAGAARLAPGPGPRQSPVRGVLLTDGELDHTLGLLVLREGSGLTVHAPELVLRALTEDFAVRPMLDRYASWTWRVAPPGTAVPLAGGLRATAFPVGAKRPKYASTVDGDWVVAYRIEDPAGGGVLVYAPCLGGWPDGFDEVVADADCVLLDGTFHGAGELGSTTGGPSGQAGMGHLPMTDSLPRLANHPGVRWVYTHLNNTNPALDPASGERAGLGGAEILPDGTEFVL
ncbi:pyrroloquinoline quinone biosynthesis protein PqqB [Solihabitans fulvus]|uniref:Coenzyme PQQ synthesis protein B n=1 Tax=Solihabitans fulvus TaxID=1892852 RepID=A0A5B2XK04_9PSEU|nr:pyrroloquinoline quinone biosynthesis protein PqqB [Solihabitans fulvus]KAA2263251.1 pyrroloquinoline quinone biosynthesis protein PqqB [Solihabitans fulvus]